jgi:hypothetical protein
MGRQIGIFAHGAPPWSAVIAQAGIQGHLAMTQLAAKELGLRFRGDERKNS